MKFFLRTTVRFLLALFIIPKNIALYLLGCRGSNKSEIVDALCTQGFYLYNEPVSAIDVEKLKSIYSDMFSKSDVKQSGQLNGRIMMPHLNSDAIRSYIDKFIPVARDYFNNKSIQVELSMFQKSKVETEDDNIPGGGYHMDDNKKNLKFFIYLTDVTDKNGPFILSPNSHGINLFKIIRWFGWEITTKRKYLYMDELPKGSSAPIPVLGKAGTIFCGDTTIYHKAARVIEGERLVLVISFAERRLDPYKYLFNGKKKSLY